MTYAICFRGVAGAGIYRPERPTLDIGSNQLKGWCRCNLGGGGEPTFEGGADMWAQGAGQLTGGAAWWNLALRFGVKSSRVFWNLLVSVSPWISAIKSDILVHLVIFSR